ncbi:MAG: hypothetical protein LBP92_06975 [Deltaproteobacteria bacterium]|jgi:hypothetical protein|nr:hypothetical protein [Deltaproteobacteria bacterium]
MTGKTGPKVFFSSSPHKTTLGFSLSGMAIFIVHLEEGLVDRNIMRFLSKHRPWMLPPGVTPRFVFFLSFAYNRGLNWQG